MNDGIKARPIGRVLRLMMGAALVIEAARHMVGGSTSLTLRVTGVVVGLLIFYALAHLFISKYLSSINRWAGAFIAVSPVIAVFVLGGGAGQLGSLLFVGVSLLVTAIRADGGCEVMTLPGIILGNRTHLVCIVFSPLDWVEEKLTGSRERNKTSSDI